MDEPAALPPPTAAFQLTHYSPLVPEKLKELQRRNGSDTQCIQLWQVQERTQHTNRERQRQGRSRGSTSNLTQNPRSALLPHGAVDTASATLGVVGGGTKPSSRTTGAQRSQSSGWSASAPTWVLRWRRIGDGRGWVGGGLSKSSGV